MEALSITCSIILIIGYYLAGDKDGLITIAGWIMSALGNLGYIAYGYFNDSIGIMILSTFMVVVCVRNTKRQWDAL